MRMANHNPARRVCLGGCGKEFWSMGPGNRVCGRCKDRRGTVPLSKRQEEAVADTRRVR